MASRIVSSARIAAAIALLLLGISGTASAQVVGFGGSTMTGWTANNNYDPVNQPGSLGLPSVAGGGGLSDTITMTNNNGGIATSYWFNTPQSITNFTESFTYTTNGGADGIAIVWHNAGLNALGGGGGSLGYGAGVSNSAAMGMNIYGGNSGSGSSYTLPTTANNGVPTTPTPGGVNITNGDPINVSLSYKEADGALTETMTDANTNATFTRVWRNISIQSAVGGTTATIGLTGGTGGVNATQTITNFQFTPGNANPTPVAKITPIGTTGYNQNMVISAANGTANVTATFDGGTGRNGDTFYEQGYNPNSPSSGVPQAGVVFGSSNDANHTFAMQPNGAGQNDALMLDGSSTSGTLTLTTPGKFSLLSFLVSGANGGGNINGVINFAGGNTQPFTIAGLDWFNNAPIAWGANGRGTLAGAYDNTNGGNPRMYQDDLTVNDTVDNILSVDFTFGGSNREMVFGISGQPVAVPEPSSMALLSLGAAGLLARWRRRK